MAVVDRLTHLSHGPRALPLPVFFPSVSSVKTALRPMDYVQLLSSLAGVNDQFLVSAFDLARIDEARCAREVLDCARNAGALVLMDSGNYESSWKDAQASWKQADFHRVLSAFPCDLAFGFDEQAPPGNFDEDLALIVNHWQADQAVAGDRLIVPIVHAADRVPASCAAVAAETGVAMIAVAERRLGDGVAERARSVRAIREALNKLDRYVVLHLLGTGNPISMALYTAMGADSFDGLEWCQTVVDHDTAALHHLSHADFFAGQTAWGDAGLSFQARTLAHNLEFFADWMRRLRDATGQGHLEAFCRLNMPSRAFRHCADVVGWSRP